MAVGVTDALSCKAVQVRHQIRCDKLGAEGIEDNDENADVGIVGHGPFRFTECFWFWAILGAPIKYPGNDLARLDHCRGYEVCQTKPCDPFR